MAACILGQARATECGRDPGRDPGRGHVGAAPTPAHEFFFTGKITLRIMAVLAISQSNLKIHLKVCDVMSHLLSKAS